MLKNKLIKSFIAMTTLGIASLAFANSSTLLVKNHTKTGPIYIEVYGEKHSLVASKNILLSEATHPEPWIIHNWIWEKDAFDYIDFFFFRDGQKVSCGTIEPQIIPWGTTISRAIVVNQCDDAGFDSANIDMLAVK